MKKYNEKEVIEIMIQLYCKKIIKTKHYAVDAKNYYHTHICVLIIVHTNKLRRFVHFVKHLAINQI